MVLLLPKLQAWNTPEELQLWGLY